MLKQLLLIPLLLLLPAGAIAQSVAVAGDPSALVVASAVAGSQPDHAVDDATTYTLMAVAAGSRLRARLLTTLPDGVVLEAVAEAPAGAQSAGWVALDASPRSLVTGLPAGTHDAQTITYRLTVTTGVAPAFRSFTVLFEVDL